MKMHSLGIDIGGTSVKAALLDSSGQVLSTTQSQRYARPSTDQLLDAIRQALSQPLTCPLTPPLTPPLSVGICLPGRLDSQRRMITLSVNVPGLNGIVVEDLIRRALGDIAATIRILSDAHATAFDLWIQRRPAGRMLVLALGTGVGAAVLDDGQPLHVDGTSPGHIGQLDVSIEGEPAIGPDGGAGSLEGYLGAAALARRYGPDFYSALAAWNESNRDEAPLRALARAIRICHAIYRPHHVLLAGGIGIALSSALPALRHLVDDRLSSIAFPGWTLSSGHSHFHAAIGAARLALPAHSVSGINAQ